MRGLTLGALLAVMVAGGAQAQVYPARPITLIVPYSAGGPTDTLGRIMAEHMRGTLGQTVVVENVTGAGGTIGVGRVARAAADGYTVGSARSAPTTSTAPPSNCPTTSCGTSRRSRC